MSSRTYKDREREAILGLREIVYYFRQFRSFLANVAGSVSQGNVPPMVVEIEDTQDSITVETHGGYCPFRRLDKGNGVATVSEGGMKGDISNYLQNIPLVQISDPLKEFGHILTFFLGKLELSRSPNSKERYVISRWINEHVFDAMPSLKIVSFRMMKGDDTVERTHADFESMVADSIKVGEFMIEQGLWSLTDSDESGNKLSEVVLE